MGFTEETIRYLDQLAERTKPPFYVPRRFRASDEWDKWSANDWRGHRFGQEPELDAILNAPFVAILGEPGAGKSTMAFPAILEARRRGWIPVLLHLRGYAGSLADLVTEAVPESVRAVIETDPDAVPFFILDGFDELPAEQLARFPHDLAALLDARPTARVMLTSRQAFFANRRTLFGEPPSAFYLLDLNDDDQDLFIKEAEVDRIAFRAAAADVHLGQELANPFALKTFLAFFQSTGTLGKTRSEILRHVIERTLATHPTSDPRQELQALRMLALAMEIAARNELLESEAKRVLETAFRISAADAERLLAELSESILIRTPNGYAFQMRSYGEYLAASELSDVRERDRLLEPLFLMGTLEPHDSWRNAVSYLVETNAGARNYFADYFPDWLLTASPNVFNEDQRTRVSGGVFRGLRERQEYLVHHPIIRAAHLARFVTPAVISELRELLKEGNDVAVANAVLLLGAAKDHTVGDLALDLALDGRRSLYVRHSALSALDVIGRPDMIPRLLDIADWSEPTVSSRIDAASSVMDTAHMPRVVIALGRTDVTISSAYYRFGELDRPEELETIIRTVLQIDPTVLSSRFEIYLNQAWTHLGRLWQPHWAPLVADLLLRMESMDDGHLSKSLAEVVMETAGHAQVSRELAQRLLSMEPPIHIYGGAPKVVTLEDTQWLQEQPGSEEAVSILRAFGAPAVREHLFAARRVGQVEDPAPSAKHEEILAGWQRKHEERERSISEAIAAAQTSDVPEDVLRALLRLDRNRWPELSEEQRQRLGLAVEKLLSELDLPARIVWSTDFNWSVPHVLPGLLQVIDHFELKLQNDSHLAEVLRAHEGKMVATYAKRFGLSPSTIERIEKIGADVATPNGALEGVIEFFHEVATTTPAALSALEAALVTDRPDHIKSKALRALNASEDGRGVVAARVSDLNGELKESAELALIEAQHRPTIQRRLAALTKNPDALKAAGPVRPFEVGPLGWIRHIRLREVWDELVQLRVAALQRAADHAVIIITEALSHIDPVEAADVVLKQIEHAPAEWQPVQRIQAIEYRRNGKLQQAQNAPFERVIARLRAFSTMMRYKVWVEGPTDVPGVDVLLQQIPDTEGVAQSQMFGGWNQVLNQHWSPRGLGDGCSDFTMLFDGDAARDWSTADHPIKKGDISRVLQKLEEHKVPFHVLERYALENYFPQHAFEKVLGRSLAGKFPLDPTRGVNKQLAGYSKEMNPRIAAETQLADLAGTDLGQLLDVIRQRLG